MQRQKFTLAQVYYYRSPCKAHQVFEAVSFPSVLKSAAESHPPTIMDELRRLEYYQGKGRPQYSAAVMRYALLQRYNSAPSYRLMLEQFPLTSFRLLYKMHKGGIDSLKIDIKSSNSEVKKQLGKLKKIIRKQNELSASGEN